MAEIFFTITGTNHWHGSEFIKPDMKVKLVSPLVIPYVMKIEARIVISKLIKSIFLFLSKELVLSHETGINKILDSL